jgi:hypothetical protein
MKMLPSQHASPLLLLLFIFALYQGNQSGLTYLRA